MDFYYNGLWRLDIGFGNPNKSAIFILLPAILIWILPFFKSIRNWSLLVSFVISFIGLGLVIHTASRGAIVAACFALVVVLAFCPRPWSSNLVFVGSIAIFILIAYSLVLGFGFRALQGVDAQDRSITNRLQIWSQAPLMMADAPSGWGFGNSGKNYVQWYAPLGSSEGYRTLVNSHLTWMVEGGRVFQFIYLLSWAAVIWLLWPSSNAPVRAVCLATVLAFFIGATFSSVAEEWLNWIVPVIAIFLALGTRIIFREVPDFRGGAVCLVIVSISFTSLVFWGKHMQDKRCIHVARDGIVTCIGNGDEKYIVVSHSRRVLGKFYGHSLRESLNEKQSVLIYDYFPDKNLVVPDGSKLILVDYIPLDKLSEASLRNDIIVVTPWMTKKVPPLNKRPTNIIYFSGEFDRSSAARAWQRWASNEESVKFVKIQGADRFIPNWWSAITASD